MLFNCYRFEFEARNLKKEAKELEIYKNLENLKDNIKLEIY